MNKTPNNRGSPKKADAKSAAERMRAYRKRKRDAGLANVRRWEPIDGLPAGRYSDHRILDARSLAMHCRIVQLDSVPNSARHSNTKKSPSPFGGKKADFSYLNLVGVRRFELPAPALSVFKQMEQIYV